MAPVAFLFLFLILSTKLEVMRFASYLFIINSKHIGVSAALWIKFMGVNKSVLPLLSSLFVTIPIRGKQFDVIEPLKPNVEFYFSYIFGDKEHRL